MEGGPGGRVQNIISNHLKTQYYACVGETSRAQGKSNSWKAEN